MVDDIIFGAESVKMKAYQISIEDPFVQMWFNLLYAQARLGATVEKITKYYMGYILQLDEEELEKYYYVKPKNESFVSEILKIFDRKPEVPKIEIPFDNLFFAKDLKLEK